jgi:hypothetical protein
MPLPAPSGKESEQEFVSRCVKHLHDKGESGSDEQLVAMCYSQFKRGKAAQGLANMIMNKCPKCGKKNCPDKSNQCPGPKDITEQENQDEQDMQDEEND